jgi:hypothetical protein
MLDPTGVCVQKWILKGAWISNCNFNNLDYSQDGIADINATIVVDYCILCFNFQVLTIVNWFIKKKSY